MSYFREAQMHAIDHMTRLHAHLQPPPGMRRMKNHARLQPALALARDALSLAQEGLAGQAPAEWLGGLRLKSAQLAELHRRERPAVLRQTAAGAWEPAAALDALDAMRWLARVGHHASRTCNYLAGERAAQPALQIQDTGDEG